MQSRSWWLAIRASTSNRAWPSPSSPWLELASAAAFRYSTTTQESSRHPHPRFGPPPLGRDRHSNASVPTFHNEEISPRVPTQSALRYTVSNVATSSKVTIESELEQRLFETLCREDVGHHGDQSFGSSLSEAYMHARREAPHVLSLLPDEALERLCTFAASEGHSEVVQRLLEDLGGYEDIGASKDISGKGKCRTGGLLNAPKGSKRQESALQSLMIAAATINNDEIQASKDISEQASMMSRLEVVQEALIKEQEAHQERRSQDSSPTALGTVAALDPRTVRLMLRSIVDLNAVQFTPLLAALFNRLISLADTGYPSPIEGSRLLTFLLSLPRDVDLEGMSYPKLYKLSPVLIAAARVLQEMRATNADNVTEAMIRNASEDGQNFAAEARALGNNDQATIALEMTLRSIVVRIYLSGSRFGEVCHALKELVGQNVSRDGKESSEIVRRIVKMSVNVMLSKGTGLKQAHTIITEHADVLVGGKDHGDRLWLSKYAHLAMESRQGELLTSAILRLINAQRGRMNSGLAPEALCIGSKAITFVFQDLCKRRQNRCLSLLLEQVGIVSESGQILDYGIDALLESSHKSKLICSIAIAGLKQQAMALYERWGSKINSAEFTHQEDIKRHIDDFLQSAKIAASTPSLNVRAKTLSDEMASPVVQSRRVLVTMVRLLVRKGKHTNNNVHTLATTPVDRDVQRAYQIVSAFFKSKPWRLHDHRDISALASVYFFLGQDTAAFHCMASITRRKITPSVQDSATLVRGLADKDLEGTVNLVINHLSSDSIALNVDKHISNRFGASIAQALIHKCTISGRIDLATRILACVNEKEMFPDADFFAEKHLILVSALMGNQENHDSLKGELRDEAMELQRLGKGRASLQLIRRMQRLMGDTQGWIPSAPFLAWWTNACIYERRQDARSGFKDAKTEAPSDTRLNSFAIDNNRIRAAIALLHLSSEVTGSVEEGILSDVIQCIQNKAFNLDQQNAGRSHYRELVRLIDNVTHIARWTPDLVPKWRRSYQDKTMMPLDSEDGGAPHNFQDGQAAFRPSVERIPKHGQPSCLSPKLFRSLIAVYLRTGDAKGAVEVSTWARVECQMSLTSLSQGWKGGVEGERERISRGNKSFPRFVKDAVFTAWQRKERDTLAPPEVILKWFAGVDEVPRDKLWWNRDGSV